MFLRLITLIGYFFAGYGVGWCVLRFIRWISGREEQESSSAKRLSKEDKESCRAYYQNYKDDSSVIHLDFDSFKSYYSLNPDSWLLMDCFAYKETSKAFASTVEEAKRRYERYGSQDPCNTIQAFIGDTHSYYKIHFQTVDDYYKYVAFRKEKELQKQELEEMQRQIRRDEAKKKLTKEFLESVQGDIDHIRQLSEEEYGQALETFSEVNERMNGGRKPVIERPESLGGVQA